MQAAQQNQKLASCQEVNMSTEHDDDSGLPEESSSKLEQENAVPVEEVGPWYKEELGIGRGREIFKNCFDMWEYGENVIFNARRPYKIVCVIDNTDTIWDGLLYPNQPHWWVGERIPALFPENVPDDFKGDIDFIPLYEKMIEWREENIKQSIKPRGSVRVSNYKGVPVYLPDPMLDYSRPPIQVGQTTGAKTNIKTITTTNTSASGSTTQETVVGNVAIGEEQQKDIAANQAKQYDDAILRKARTKTKIPPSANTASREGSNTNDATNFGVGETVTSAVTDPLNAFGGAGGDVGQNNTGGGIQVPDQISGQGQADPCLPNNPQTTSAGTATAPASEPYQDRILRQSRDAAAAPETPLDAFGGPGPVTPTAPTTVTGPDSANAQSAPEPIVPGSVYIYEPLTPGFDRYDFNSGKKVYTPNSGASRTNQGQLVTSGGTTEPAPAAPVQDPDVDFDDAYGGNFRGPF